jgi:predicted hydrolase (HD superfamily)
MNNKCIPSSIGASASSQRSGTVPKNIKRIQQEILRVEAEAKEYAKKHGYDVDRYSETAVLKHLGYKQPS